MHTRREVVVEDGIPFTSFAVDDVRDAIDRFAVSVSVSPMAPWRRPFDDTCDNLIPEIAAL
jgi:hypothetical protein